ncbi:MAG TPA: hypothetical protein VGH73_16190 [Thermoanaerobaculia bacterium]|jgi:hypothetical protein
MTREEYEQRKRRVEEQLREGIALLETAHRRQLQALELVWMTSTDEDLASGPKPAAEPVAARSEPPPPVPAPPRRRSPFELTQDLAAAWPGVPETFNLHHLREALGYEPDRGSLYRILQQLVKDGNLSVQRPGAGKVPTLYRKTGADNPLPDL